ncbi:MAG: beta-ketoacyl-ACP synthase II [Phycisphaeraceae bacterium]|nr:beta-ketoacyl-ACP synthase II [Phycisphaeraceae bacterium]
MPNTRHPHRVVITGMGAVTNLGPSAGATWDAMRAGRSGVSMIELPEFAKYEGKWTVKIAGQIKGWTPPADMLEHREAKRMDRFAQFGVVAGVQAVRDSGIDFSKENPERCGVVVGSGVGGIITIEDGVGILHDRGPDRLSPFTVPKLMVNAATGNLSIMFGLQGPATAHATACASSGHAMGDAVELLRRGKCDVVLAGGAEAAISPICVGAFMVMRALSTRNDAPERASRPFDKDRDGFVLGEGAAMYVLETEEHAKKRGARIYAEVVGHANAGDAFHITAPDEAGRGAMRSMRWALEDAGLNPGQIGYVNAHGTSTPLGDKAESLAVKTLFGDHALKSRGGKLMMSSTKSMHGHGLGASGAIETIACIHAVRDGVIAPTINLDNPDDDADLELVPHHARERRVDYVMNNTFGFGGHNVTLIIGRYA